MSGVVGARIVLIAVMPLLTRLYDPADFALLAVYMAIVGVISVIGCLRFEAAIPLARSDRDATCILIAAAAALLLVSCLLGVVVLGFGPEVLAALNHSAMEPYLWLVVVSVGVVAMNGALQAWAVREKRFGQLARTKASQAILGSGVMLGFGWLGVGPFGLLLGNLSAMGAGGLSLLARMLTTDRPRFSGVRIAEVWAVVVRYRRYPAISSFEALANVGAAQIPILIIAVYLETEVGQLFLAMQVMMLPLTLVGASVAQVYHSRAREHLDGGTLADFTAKTVRNMARLGFGPIFAGAIACPFVFPWLFGAEWRHAGTIALLLAPWMFMQFLSGPISSVMLLRDRHMTFLAMQVAVLVFRVSVLMIAASISLEAAIPAYSVSGALVCAGTLFVYARCAGLEAMPLAQSVLPRTWIGAIMIVILGSCYVISVLGVI